MVAGFEVGSAGEIALVRAAAPEVPIVFGGPGKTDADLAAAVRAGVAAVHVESVHELRRAEHVAAGLGVTLPVALRVNLAGPLPVATLAMAGRPTQFGIDEADVPDALALALGCAHLEVVGFHFHTLSNHHDAPAHARLVAGYLDRAGKWAADAGVPPASSTPAAASAWTTPTWIAPSIGPASALRWPTRSTAARPSGSGSNVAAIWRRRGGRMSSRFST